MAWICSECGGDGTVYDAYQKKNDCWDCDGRGWTFDITKSL